MPVLTWTCAHGDSPAVTLPLAATTAISPADDSVDANIVVITGTGTIYSLGPCAYPITKQLIFGAGVTLAHSAQLTLLTGGDDRVIPGPSVSTFMTHGDGVWKEISFSTLQTVDPLTGAVNDLEDQLAQVTTDVSTLQAQVTSNTNNIATNANAIAVNANNIAANAAAIVALQNTVAALQANHAAWINHLETNQVFLYNFVSSHVATVNRPSPAPGAPP